MGEVPLRHKVVCFYHTVDVFTVDTNSDTHDEMLGSLGHSAIET